MKKKIYEFHYIDFINRKCVRKIKSNCIVGVMNEAKDFCFVNRISKAKIITPDGREYYV